MTGNKMKISKNPLFWQSKCNLKSHNWYKRSKVTKSVFFKYLVPYHLTLTTVSVHSKGGRAKKFSTNYVQWNFPYDKRFLRYRLRTIGQLDLYVWYCEVNCKNQYLELVIQLFNTENIVIIHKSQLCIERIVASVIMKHCLKLNFGHA